jgi:DNA gyrase subunit A
MIMTKNGISIRIHVQDLRIMGRNTQGVRLINISEGDEIAAVTKVEKENDEQEADEKPVDVSPTDTGNGDNA